MFSVRCIVGCCGFLVIGVGFVRSFCVIIFVCLSCFVFVFFGYLRYH